VWKKLSRSGRNEITEEPEDLQMGIVEFNQVLSSIKRYSVKEVILSEIDLILAKIDSLKELTVAETDNVMLWLNVVARKKKTSPTLQNITPSNTGDNRFDLLPLNEKCDGETNSSNAVQQTKSKVNYNNNNKNSKQETEEDYYSR
jgi:hypothetical protein